MAYWRARSNPLLTRNRLKRKRFVREEIQKTATRRAISRKIWTRLSETAGRGALHPLGNTAAVNSLVVQKKNRATIKFLAKRPTKRASDLNCLKKRRGEKTS